MVTVCDRCKIANRTRNLEIKSKHYDLCEICIDDIVAYINNYKKKGFLASLGQEFKYG